MVTLVSGGLCYGHTKCVFIAIQRKIKHSLVTNITLWLENIAYCEKLWNI